MTYASSHRKGVSTRVWQTRQYYFNMLADFVDQYLPEEPTYAQFAEVLGRGIKVVAAAIQEDNPEPPPSCPT